MTSLPEFLRIVACWLERRVAAENATPVIQQDRESEFPLLDLSGHYVADLVLDQLVESDKAKSV